MWLSFHVSGCRTFMHENSCHTFSLELITFLFYDSQWPQITYFRVEWFSEWFGTPASYSNSRFCWNAGLGQVVLSKGIGSDIPELSCWTAATDGFHGNKVWHHNNHKALHKPWELAVPLVFNYLFCLIPREVPTPQYLFVFISHFPQMQLWETPRWFVTFLCLEVVTLGRHGFVREIQGEKVKHRNKPTSQSRLGGGFKYFLFSPLFGEDSQFD